MIKSEQQHLPKRKAKQKLAKEKWQIENENNQSLTHLDEIIQLSFKNLLNDSKIQLPLH